MHDWMVYFHKGEYVYREMMNDSDRQRIQQWLEDIWNGASENQLEWTNIETGLRFTFRFCADMLIDNLWKHQ